MTTAPASLPADPGFVDFLVRAGVLTFGDFVTKSGRPTPYFANFGNVSTGRHIAQLGRFYAERIATVFGDEVDVVFGPAYKGIPLAVSAAAALAAVTEHGWGRFDVRLDAPGIVYRTIEALMNLRSRLTGICTGDQAIFVQRALWQQCGGYPRVPLMEDIALSRQLKRYGPPACLHERVRVSARRWQLHGVLRTTLAMWLYRALYWFGVSPAWIHRRYYGHR